VDDDPQLVAAAIELGYQGRWMRREAPTAAGHGGVPAVQAVTSLTESTESF